MWKDFDAEAEAAAAEQAAQAEDTSALKPEYMDIIISDVRSHNNLTFSVQILNTEGEPPASNSLYFSNSFSCLINFYQASPP